MKTYLPFLFCTFISCQVFAFDTDVVIDNADASGIEFLPNTAWVADTATTNSFRGTGKITTSSVANSLEYARFYTPLPATGLWKVFLWRNGRSTGTPDEATVRITHAEPTPSDVRFSGSGTVGEWVLAGVYWFDSSKQAEVKVIHDDTGLLAVDAVRFSYAEAETVLDSSSSGSVTFSPNTAAWPIVSELSANEQSYRRSNTVGATVTFTPTLPTPGAYEVSIWFPQSGLTTATSVSVDVVHQGTTSSFSVSLPSTGFNEGKWVQVGTTPFLFDAGPNSNNKVVVKTGPNGSDYVPADAVRFAKTGAYSVLLDNDAGAPNPPTDPGGVAPNPNPGNWQVIADAPAVRPWSAHKWIAVGPDSRRALGSGNDSMVYTPDLPEIGLYDAYIWYPFTNNSANNSIVSVVDALSQTTSLTINQMQNTAQWRHVGRYVLDPANATLTLQTPQTGTLYTIADAALFIRTSEDVDGDGDGMLDNWEAYWFHTLGRNGTGDYDGDGILDAAERAANYDPANPAPVLHLDAPIGSTLAP
jgi:hypothetical protein